VRDVVEADKRKRAAEIEEPMVAMGIE
jgi:hypothetical protein